jgi:peptidase MA superfamily protein
VKLRLTLGVLAFVAAFLAGSLEAAAATQEDLEPGCVPGSERFIVRFCLSTPPPFGQADAVEVAEGPDLFLDSVRTGAADLRVERGIGEAERTALAAAIERDVPAVERDYGHPFARRPIIQIFGSPATFERALQSVYGYPSAIARSLGAVGGGMDRPSGSIVINWGRVAADRPITILRHELSHLMVRQIVGVDASVPAWFDEGLATLSQYALGAQATALVDADYVANALLSTQRLTLAQLVTSESWLRSAAGEPSAYAVAGSATGALRGEVGQQGIVRILDLTGSGRTFEDAFAAVTQQSVASFSSGLAERVGDRAAPQIVFSAGSDARGDFTFTVRGFPPAGRIAVVIDGTSNDGRPYHVDYPVTADQSGTARGSFGSTAPAGTYAFRAVSGTVTAAGVLRTTGPR